MKKKTIISLYLILFTLFLIPLYEKMNSAIIYTNNFMVWSYSEIGFNIIIATITSIFSTLLFFFVRSKFVRRFKKETNLKEVSDDIFIIFYFIGWVAYALPLMFRGNNDTIKIYFELYLYFSIISPAYIIFIKMNHLVKKIREKDENISLFNLGNFWNYLEIIAITCGSMILIFFISLLLPQTIGFLTEYSDFILFMATVSIPVEEIIFRGLIIDVCIVIIIEISSDIKKIPRDERNKDNETNNKIKEIAWIIAIIISSVLFAFYHLNRYGKDSWIISYLIIMGIIMGFARYIGGLSSAYLIHLINNIMATASASIFVANSNIYLPQIFSICFCILFTCFLYYRKRLSKSKQIIN